MRIKKPTEGTIWRENHLAEAGHSLETKWFADNAQLVQGNFRSDYSSPPITMTDNS